MNQSIPALITKLNWQHDELLLHLNAIENEAQEVIKQISELENLINKPEKPPTLINPEFEMNRLNFIMRQQEKMDELVLLSKNHESTAAKLKEKLQRIKSELKMLEKYVAREEQTLIDQQRKMQEQSMDEWVIQKRETI